ncbi:MAG: META domain-containing protein [Actinobacteria bacterium]|nr:META domain-containing protein [Actinomycetota bacterium]
MKKYWILSVGLVALLAACSSGTPAAPAAGPTLEGTSWTVTQLGGKATLENHRPTMKFAEGRVGGTTGCNSWGTSFTQTGATLALGTEIAMTAMACTDDAVMAQEAAVSKALPTIASVRTAGSGAELLDASGQVVFTLARVENKPLEGTTWHLSGLVADTAVSSTVADSVVTMTISGGSLSGKACNTFRGTVTAADGSFTAGPLMSTKMACPSAELTAQETTVLANLAAATHYAIEGDTLTLSGDDGSGLVFTAA